MGVALLAILIGSLLYFARRAKKEHTLVMPAKKKSEEWVFDVRDMNAEVRKKESKKHVEYFELRRISARRWEIACEETPDGPIWRVMDEPFLSAVEEAFVDYNGGAPDRDGVDAGGGPYRS